MNPHSEPFVPQFTLLPGADTLSVEGHIGYAVSHPGVHDTQWTPIWSDVFTMAQEKRAQEELRQHEEFQAGRRWVNYQRCRARNLIHVQPRKEMCCDVLELEKSLATLIP